MMTGLAPTYSAAMGPGVGSSVGGWSLVGVGAGAIGRCQVAAGRIHSLLCIADSKKPP